MIEIELHHAYMFDCNHCGRENYVRPIHRELDLEEATTLKDKYNIDQESIGRFEIVPDYVQCHHCHAKFKPCYPDIHELEG